MNGGDLSQQQQQQQHQQQHQQWMAMQQYQQQQWMSMHMQYPAAAMVMHQQQQMMYGQQYVPAYYHQHPQHQFYQQQQQQQQQKHSQIQASSDENRTIWIGDLHQWMDESYIQSCFAQASEDSVVFFGAWTLLLTLKEADKITTLPGQPINGVNFDQYSGYVTVDPYAGRALFYYFTESENPSSKPLVLWLNGGPGCSSIGAGAMTELGPFRVNKDGKTLWYNQYAWNKVANVLFLESPAGVGFSYSNTSSDYFTGDKQTAADSYTFLVNWLERFPEYKTRDFLITGESYAGHYVPQLAKLILHNNKITNHSIINLKGIAVGNAYVDYETQHTGTYDYLWSHALISDEIHEGIVTNCNFSFEATISVTCQEYMDQADIAEGHIYDFDIYAPLCSSSSTVPLISTYDPCSGSYVFSYLNTIEAQKSLHANVTQLPGKWSGCNNFIGGNWKGTPDTVLPIIKELMASGINVWIYSGDTDSKVTVTTTRYAIHKLGIPVKTPWYPWYAQGEVGGYVVEYQNLTFVTIRGAGHFVPRYQPARALTFFSSFLDGKLPPSKQN